MCDVSRRADCLVAAGFDRYGEATDNLAALGQLESGSLEGGPAILGCICCGETLVGVNTERRGEDLTTERAVVVPIRALPDGGELVAHPDRATA